MTGLTEILLIIAIILAIFVLPKRFGRKPEPVIRLRRKSLKLTGWNRMAILLSILWLAFFAFYLEPWNNEWQIFLYAGISPVVLYWGIFWIILGFRKKGR
ncbi:MAG: hypothetical protein PVG39_15440 [Desulfobacteraceae bacterium]|jgi:hypothetical protein